MAISLNQLSWHQKDNQITTYFGAGSGIYTIRFTRSPDNFSENIKQLFVNQENIIIPDSAWKITVDLFDETGKQLEWVISQDSGIEEFTNVVAVTQHFEELINPDNMVFVCPNSMFTKIGELFATTVRVMWDVTPINSDNESYFYFSKKDTTSV